jgi:hypothetical protein
MNRSNFKYYEEQANKWKENNFNLNVSRDEYHLAHLLCEASMLSKYGMNGAAFRHWVSGLFKDGIFLYVDNYDIGIKCTEDPNATLNLQCQNSCAHGDPWPKPSNGEWINYNKMSDNIKEYVDNIIKELCEHAYELVILESNKINDMIQEEIKQDELKNNEIQKAWEDKINNN